MTAPVKIGLEIHVQLGGRKLFCECPTESDGTSYGSIYRKLSLSTGEMGNYDPAAVYEKGRSRVFEYEISDNSCLVEYDEEPPHDVNSEALLKGLAVSQALNCRTVDVLEYMRKIVVDGSNTSGFQRTAIISFGGWVDTTRGRVRISTICLEEDSARKISDASAEVSYSLDRLGIPLLEIATEPDIVDGEHAVEVAKQIGDIILLSGWSRRAPESIRQDVNFSMGYGRVEIKGVPKLSVIRDCLLYEKERQASLKEIADRLGNNWENGIEFTDVTHLFAETGSKVIRKSLDAGMKVYASLLPGLNGYLKNGAYRLGRELADVAKLYGSGGIMHSDELPGYGVKDEVKSLKDMLKPRAADGFFIIVSDEAHMGIIGREMNSRISKILRLDLSETRYADAQGETHYLRPLPGGERMYPETDIPNYPITQELVMRSREIAPKTREELIAEFCRKYGISRQEASSIIVNNLSGVIEDYASVLGNGKLVARLLLQVIPDLEKKASKDINLADVRKLLTALAGRNAMKEEYERALDLLIVQSMPIDSILVSPEMKVMDEGELRKVIVALFEGDSINEKNLIPRLRATVRGIFDPSTAFRIFKDISGKQN
ncbi:MAG: Glu-tRNA(Gln) amidotransferase subunit GatE [Candidatus Thermoplasmatota archaeon]|nr:Glu-tRNA(Gln) amidotransferase subunit GatE [Candidatus Thermoplasmatota archaeon]MCL5732279.1 Glu-tRNA(Gln) amidotransferase subunit GatE [Candidatus Thermoplasmatota archaeon]